MDVSDEDMSQVFKAVSGVLNCGNVKFRDVLDNHKTTEVVGVLDEEAHASEYARCECGEAWGGGGEGGDEEGRGGGGEGRGGGGVGPRWDK